MAIHILSPFLASQIAAGEVIERPASVLKELLENSLDANAKDLEIEIGKGGTELIRVRDNGIGIAKYDLSLAIHRHATSKIENINDLEKILTLGFWGEALASISSVSKLTLNSRPKNQDLAWQIRSSNDINPQEITPCSHPFGTTTEVRDLFFNTPARRKFLRSEQTEFRCIVDIVNRISLSRFDVGFILKHNDRVNLKLEPANTPEAQKKRIAEILGDDFLVNALEVKAEQNNFKLTGFIAKPTFSRNQNDRQYFYINGRFIRDKFVAHAIRLAYQDVLAHGRHSAFVLYLEIDPSLVDVNVHPTKHEVRFRESRMVHDFLVHSLKRVLANTKPNYHQEISENIFTKNFATKILNPSETNLVNKNTWHNFVSSKLQNQKQFLLKSDFMENEAALVKPNYNLEKNDPLNNNLSIKASPLKEDLKNNFNTEEPLGYALAQIHGTYIVSETADSLILVDAHAAHERITYERLKEAHKNANLKTQPLLLPLTINVSNEEVLCAEEYAASLKEIGIDLEILGENNLVIRGLPALLTSKNAAEIIRDVLADLAKYETSEETQNYIDRILSTFACHHSIRANRKMTILEMNELLRQLENTNRSNQCSHGRPTFVKITIQEIAKMFGRSNVKF